VTVFLVRHADAGERASWNGDDRLRPLSPQGERESQGIAHLLADQPVGRVLSSPYLRCVQSVEPLAATRGLAVERDDDLAEGASLDRVHRVLRRVSDGGVVVCTHGDVIEAALTDLFHRGAVAADELRWPKASIWVLEPWAWEPAGTTAESGAPAAPARYLAPPLTQQ
jgi:8-oxo-dGTP diphosphatase